MFLFHNGLHHTVRNWRHHWQRRIGRAVLLGWRLRLWRGVPVPSDVPDTLALTLASVGCWQQHIYGNALEQGVIGMAVAGLRNCRALVAMPWCSGGSVAYWRGIALPCG